MTGRLLTARVVAEATSNRQHLQDETVPHDRRVGRGASMTQPVTNWRDLRAGDRVRVLDPLVGGEFGRVVWLERCVALDSAWAHVANGGPVNELVLLVDGHPPKLGWADAR